MIGTDQRITSGPAAKRLHSKAGYMAAPERFAKKSDSFPLHRGRRPYTSIHGTSPLCCDVRDQGEYWRVTRAMWAALADAVRTKKLRLPIDKIFPLEQAKAAQVDMRAKRHFGKILLVT